MGELSVRIGAEYPLADVPRAHEDLAARRTTGKLILVAGTTSTNPDTRVG